MNRGAQVADAVRRGAGRVAIVLGDWCEAYRASVCNQPLAAENRFLRLQATFAPPGEGFRPPAAGSAGWWGTFDSAYTRVGDYIKRLESKPGAGDGDIWFIASQEPLLPVLCFRTNRTITITRSTGPADRGVNGYGGVNRGTSTPVAEGWPASVLASAGRGAVGADLPPGLSPGSWQVQLPAIPGVRLSRGDILGDEGGWSGAVAAAELSAMGWRLIVREAAA